MQCPLDITDVVIIDPKDSIRMGQSLAVDQVLQTALIGVVSVDVNQICFLLWVISYVLGYRHFGVAWEKLEAVTISKCEVAGCGYRVVMAANIK